MLKYFKRFCDRILTSDVFVFMGFCFTVVVTFGVIYLADQAKQWHRDELCAQGVERFCPGYKAEVEETTP